MKESKVLLDIIEGFDIYSSFIAVRKFKLYVGAIVKRYPGCYRMLKIHCTLTTNKLTNCPVAKITMHGSIVQL